MNNTFYVGYSWFTTSIAASMVFLLSSCTHTTSAWDSHFGESVRLAISQQTLNPQAGLNPDFSTGIDGKAAREAMGRYQNSFKEPSPATNNFTIGVSR